MISDEETLRGTKPVTVNAKNLSLTDFLTLILKDQRLEYTINSRTIVITRKPGLNKTAGDVNHRLVNFLLPPLPSAGV